MSRAAGRKDCVFATRAACPRCGEWRKGRLETVRSVADAGDGVGTQDKRCRSCGHAFDLVLTPPGDPLGQIEDLIPQLTPAELAELRRRVQAGPSK